MAVVREKTKQIGAWFLGPKAENASMEEEMILHILRDYFHWRRNYYPADEITITQHMRRESLDWSDALLQQITEMLARLKRDFPFYSPRYLAHMLSDQTIPSVLGYFAGMLYNPNNVTPEAAPVTVEYELEVAADILRMLGYKAPPSESAPASETRKEFGWAHITGGGTVANLEALWVARNVRYSTPAIRRASIEAGIPLRVKLPGGAGPMLLSEIDERQSLALKPNEAIFLLPRFIDGVKHKENLSDTEASRKAWQMLCATGLNPGEQGIECYHGWPPAIFVSGTAHYSIMKAADILGIGRQNVVLVDVDRMFRMDVRDLEEKAAKALAEGRYPLAVIAIVGTTEEGAVDPVHRIADFRQRFEKQHDVSFWLHADAAWSGYVRTIFVPGARETVKEEEPLEPRIQRVNEFASHAVEIRQGNYHRTVEVRWGNKDVAGAFHSLAQAESVVVDPHKMGYVPYPCGVVAFRNDRVRHFMTQEAPYITVVAGPDVGTRAYRPPANVGPYILEGSKPGAAAASCWLSHRMIPPNRDGYGEIVRASLLAARELYERLTHWERCARANKAATSFEFVPITAGPPDTNVVCFVVREKGCRLLESMNRLSSAVYQRFAIQAELGEREYSYSQPFFLSRTRFHEPQYSCHAVAELLERAGVDSADYPRLGIFVLRATVMTPYIILNAETNHKQAFLAELVESLARAAEECIREQQ